MRNSSLVVYGFFILALLSVVPPSVDAASNIKEQISQYNDKVREIEEEIAEYQKQLNVLGTQKQSLQSAIKTLDVSRSQTASQIRATENKIGAANLKLQELALEINDKETIIAIDRATVAQSLRKMAVIDDRSMVEYLFSASSISDAWRAVDAAGQVNEALNTHVASLLQTKQVLTSQQEEVGVTKNKLTSLSVDLGNQKKSLDANRQAKDTLLQQTQNEESNYQALIAKKRAEQAAFEAELRRLEDQLNVNVDVTSIPSPGSGVLRWPFSDAYMAACSGKQSALSNIYCITQYFGNTPFATANPQVYNGGGHSGVDFSAPQGTPIQSALSGVVTDTGNTDATPGCYSYGRWVLVKHGNGLSTLYAHLSSVQVSAGQNVGTGSVLGYSGMTGYATGPHLHFTVFASDGVQVMTLAQFRGATSPCASAKMPVAPREAYLNPMSYL